MTPVRLEPPASRSRVKHSTAEPLHSLFRGFTDTEKFIKEELKNSSLEVIKFFIEKKRICFVNNQLQMLQGLKLIDSKR